MKYSHIDIHSHLNLEQFDTDRDSVIEDLKQKNIATITVGCDYKTSVLAIELADKYEHLFACVGQHPTDTVEDFDYDKFLSLAKNEKVVAIGECGLDYFRQKNDEIIEKQKNIFLQQIKIAQTLNKPLMIHARPSKNSMDAYIDVLDILDGYKDIKSNFHFFVGDLSIAKRILERGDTMSFDGPITFSRDYDEVIKFIPIESIMAETDAPFASPAPHRGKRCTPDMVTEVIKRIAEIKEMTFEDTSKQLLENANRVFGI